MRAIRRTLWSIVALAACADDVNEVLGGSEGSSSTDAVDTSTTDAPQVCTPRTRTCDGDDVRVCNDLGEGWFIEPCGTDESCDDGECVSPPAVEIETEILEPGQVGAPYLAQLDANGGAPEYTWSTGDDPPPGLALDPAGTLEGTPEQSGDYVLDVIVEDTLGATASRKLSLAIHSEPLTILTPPDLGVVDEGIAFSKPLLATGGIAPYGWFFVGGAPPAGVFIDGAGVLGGVPTEAGAFDFTIRVVDVADPPGWDELDFTLDVELRPLEIIGEQSIDLLAFEIIQLPLIAISPGVPVPYMAQLEATGGQVPYAWTEQPVPEEIAFLVGEAGVPEGLVLEESGLLSGSVISTDQVITIDIPLSPISLTGFFFYAQVTDSQDPAENDAALFLIPTLPVGG
jgi:hypothetical protein